jgi:hypothetical protein
LEDVDKNHLTNKDRSCERSEPRSYPVVRRARARGVSYKEIRRAELSRGMRSVSEVLSSGRAWASARQGADRGTKELFNRERGGLLLVVNGG